MQDKYLYIFSRFHSANDHVPSSSPASNDPHDKNTLSINFKSPRKGEDILGTQSDRDKMNNVPPVDDSTTASRSVESESETDESDSEETGSSGTSDSLPDLNDPTYGKEVQTKKKLRRKKKKSSLNIRPNLMKTARKTFEHKNFMYKISKEYLKNSKTTKELGDRESESHHKKLECHSPSTVLDHNSPNKLPQLSPYKLPDTSHRKNSTTQSSQKSSSELLERLVRYAEYETSNPGSDDNIDSGLDSLNPVDAVSATVNANDQGNTSTLLVESDDSDSTVIFENPPSHGICHIESVHSLSTELDTDVNDMRAVAENVNRSKRKDISVENSESNVGSKKLRKDQQLIPEENDLTERPMVVIPMNISNQQYCSSNASSVPTVSQTHTPQQTQSGHGLSINGSHTDATIPTVKQDPGSEEDVTVLDGRSSDESSRNSVENTHFIQASFEDGTNCNPDNSAVPVVSEEGVEVHQNQMPNNVNLDAAPAGDQGKSSSDSEKVAVSSVEKSFMSLKQMSRQFEELTTKRNEVEDKIKQVKEEYNKKIETLEGQKKELDMGLKKLLDGMSRWKDLSSEERPTQQLQGGNTVSAGK